MANYITQRAGGFQFIVISLKEEFYSHADALIGIYSEVSCLKVGYSHVYYSEGRDTRNIVQKLIPNSYNTIHRLEESARSVTP